MRGSSRCDTLHQLKQIGRVVLQGLQGRGKRPDSWEMPGVRSESSGQAERFDLVR